MFTFGSDPEFMLMDEKGNLRTAIAVVKGSPEDRIKVKGHEYYYDNVLAECAVRPAKGRKATLETFHECLEIYAELVNPYKLSPTAYRQYPDSELQDKAARVVGCAIDKCAYRVADMKPPKQIITKTPHRSGGGHIHLGKESLHKDYGIYIAPTIVLMDLFLGIPSIHVDHDPSSNKRREIYGQAGRYRIKDYGVEYRTLGNFWLASPKLTGFVYDLSEIVLDIVENKIEEFCDINEDHYFSEKPAKAYKYKFDTAELRSAIDSSKKTNLIDLVLSHLPNGLTKDFKVLSKPKEYDMYKEWNL